MSSSGTSKVPKNDVQPISKEIEALIKQYNDLSSGKDFAVTIYTNTRYSQSRPTTKYVKHYGLIHTRGLDIEEANVQAVFKTPGLNHTAEVETYIKSELYDRIEITGAQAESKSNRK